MKSPREGVGGPEERREVPTARARELLMRALDGELSEREREEFERLRELDPAVRREWERLSRVREVTAVMEMRSPPDEVWDEYRRNVYNRLERRLAWFLVALGAAVAGGWALWTGVHDLMTRADMPAAVRWATLALIVGGLLLLVSVLRERLFVRRSDPYREVQR